MLNGNEMKAFCRIFFPKRPGEGGLSARVPDVNETRLNDNFKTIGDEFRKIWEFIKNGFKTKSLTVDGDASVGGDLDVSSDASVGGSISVTGNATVTGDISADDVTADDVTVNGVVDITPRRCYATLSSAGWYRVLEGSTTSSATATGAQGQYIEFNIQKASSSENHSIELRFTSASGIVFVNERSRSNAQHIDKIRYAYNTTTYNWYVDIHFTDTTAHNVGVDFAVHTASATFQPSIASASLTSVAAAPSGETIVTEYTFNANGTGDLNVNGTVTGQGFAYLLFGAGNVISSNTNCDTLLTEGKYTCPSTAVGSTLTNPPYASAFGMFVFRVAEAQRLVQVAMPNSTAITVKLRYYNGTSWTAWKTLTPS